MMQRPVEYEEYVARNWNAAVTSANPACEEALSAANWYALYTRYKHEKVIAQHLDQMGFDVFLPLYREIHQWKDRRKDVVLPLFPSYVFFSGDLRRQFEVLNVPGVCSFVYSGGKVAIISAAELDAVRRAVNSRLAVEPHPFLQCGERVRVHSGPMAGVEGIITRKKGSLRLVLPVEMLCRSVSVELEEAHVERMQCP
ncbi:MAG TPA: UpxY family transcription antiterminator [Terracidiphilus sp.]|nr:UpxY family transcription antiterminator [Terracidiphilus sp.]